MNWIDNFLFSTVNELGETITSWDDVDNLPSSIIEIQATTLSSGWFQSWYKWLGRKNVVFYRFETQGSSYRVKV